MNKDQGIAASFVLALASAFLAIGCLPAHAQQAPIERIKLTDNELSCAQLHAETGAMDKVLAEARAAEGEGRATATAGQAGNVAAEVAGRTGLFGSLGGVTGALFGQLATQTAANVAQQSGQMTAAQAADRSRQALARKEHVTSLFLNKGCRASDLNYNPPPLLQGTQAAAPMQGASLAPGVGAQQVAIPAATRVAGLPDVDPDRFFKGKAGGTFGKDMIELLPAGKRVAIAGFRVVFITRDAAVAQVRGSYLPGRDTSGARSTLTLSLSGVDAATMQQITDRAYENFLGQMRLAGRELVSQEDLREFRAALDLTPTAPGKPYSREEGSQAAMAFSPTGLPLWFHHAERPWGDRGMLDQKNYKAMGEYSQKLNVPVIAPLIVVNFAQMMSSGNQSGLLARSAETGATMAMHVSAFSTHWLRSEEFRNNMIMKGDEAAASMNGRIVSELNFGELKEVSSSDNKAVVGIANAFGALAGLANAGGANSSKSESIAQTSNAAYAAAAADALARATGTFARWFQKYPAR